MAKRIAPIVPVDRLVPGRFDNLSSAPGLGLPVLVVHGDQGEVSPYALGRCIAAGLPWASFEGLPAVEYSSIPLYANPLLMQRTRRFDGDLSGHVVGED